MDEGAAVHSVGVSSLLCAGSGCAFFSADDENDCRELPRLANFVDEGTVFHVIPPYREPDAVGLGGPPGKFLNVCPN